MSEYVGDNQLATRLQANTLAYPDPQSLIPESSPYDPWYQKGLDIASMPARELAHGIGAAIGSGAESFTRAMQGDILTDPTARQDVTEATLGLGARGLLSEAEGPAAFAAWHGTRHTFDPVPDEPLGRFRESAMSTGEGAQAYAWGHYVAGQRKVAEQYKTAGMQSWEREPATFYDGQPVISQDHDIWDQAHLSPTEANAIYSYHYNGGSKDRALSELQGEADNYHHNAEYYKEAGQDDVSAEHHQLGNMKQDAANWLAANHHRLEQRAPGNMYQVWIHPEHEDMLDWDRSFQEQSPKVQSILQHHFPDATRIAVEELPGRKGGETYRDISSQPSGDPSVNLGDRGASEALDAAGIPGTKFLDGFSRNLPKVLSLDGKQWNVKSDTPELLAMHMIGMGPTPLSKLREWSLRDNIGWAQNELGKDLDEGIYRNSMATARPSSEFKEGEFVPTDHKARTEAAYDWLNENSHRLTMGDHPNASHNYVMFHNRHLSVIDRNGNLYGLEKTPTNPFTGEPVP